MNTPKIGVDTVRKEAWDKVTGRAKYTADTTPSETLYAKMLTSTFAHAIIKDIDISKALNSKGVQAIITGDYNPVLTGSMIHDKPPIARDKVRYFGEPVAVVVANSEEEAMMAVHLIKVEYEPLEVVNSIDHAIKKDSVLVHENLATYYCPGTHVYPTNNSNIMDHVKIRKGNMELGWKQSEVIVESDFTIPQSDHLAMETRNAQAEILPNGNIIIHTSSQAPFAVKEELSKVFSIPEGKIIVRTPLVGGAFGGKATVQLEFIAYLASLAVGGRPVKIVQSREEDIMISPSKLGARVKLKIGATKDGMIKALDSTFHVDCGAYSDTGPRMAKSMAIDCSGPYNIEHIHCDSFSIYTNHGFTTSYRGFGHVVSTFAIERLLDKLAAKLNMDPLDLRFKNAIKENNYSPTQAKITYSNAGDLKSCITKLKKLIDWDKGNLVKTKEGKIRAKGISCLWKTSNSPINASSGAIITFNTDGSINLSIGATEIGPSMKTTAAMILAEKLKMHVEKIHVYMHIDTQVSPKHWKTVASMTTLMVGNAVLAAAEDIINQFKDIGAIVLKCSKVNLSIKNQRVYIKDNPDIFIEFKDIVHGYKYQDGFAIGGQIIGHVSYIMRHLTPLDKETGQGRAGVSWTVGAQAVEIEYDPTLHTYRLLKAATVMDVGKVLNPKTARGLIMGGMSMGLGLATREEFLYDKDGILENTSLRTYKLIRFGENPDYYVDFVETPQTDAPFGARGLAEHGIIGIPAAFANAISLATNMEFDFIPIYPEKIWEKKTGGKL